MPSETVKASVSFTTFTCSPKSDMALADLRRWSDYFSALSLHVRFAKSAIGSYPSLTVTHFLKTQNYHQHDQFCSGAWRSIIGYDTAEAAENRSPKTQQVLVMSLLLLLSALCPPFLFLVTATCPRFYSYCSGFQSSDASTSQHWQIWKFLHMTKCNSSPFSFKLIILQRNQLSLSAHFYPAKTWVQRSQKAPLAKLSRRTTFTSPGPDKAFFARN